MRETYLIDLDGTMYQGTKIMPYAKAFINYLYKNDYAFIFFTNNASRTPKQALKHMQDLGFENISESNFFTSAMASAKHIKKYYQGNNVFCLGMDGLEQALLQEGFKLVEEKADFVFVGLDKNGNYSRYSQALRNLLDGAILVGTNNDRVLLAENGGNIGNGSVVAMFEYATDKVAIKIGKPHQVMVDECLSFFHKEKEECIIIGDNLMSDIKGGNDASIKTVLVEGGVHCKEDIDKYHIYPTMCINSLYELIKEE